MITFKKKKSQFLLFCLFSTLLFCTIVVASTLGTANISFLESLYIMGKKIPFLGLLLPNKEIVATHSTIVLNVRLPRIFLSALIGVGLSIVGASFQALFRNPMADPHVLGVSSGAALGAAIAIVLGLESSALGLSGIALFAFVGAILTTVTVYNIARIGNKVNRTTLLLAGVAVSFFLSSLLSILMVFNHAAVEKIIFWMMGSVSTVSWKAVMLLLPVIAIGLFVILAFSREMTIMLTGENTAKTLGVEVEVVKKVILVVASIVVGACVSVSGIIGFVGLIIPHIIRLLLGSNYKVLIPFSALGGAIFMIFSDTLARTIAAPAEIPVGAITSLLGVPYFLYLLTKSKKLGS